MTPPQVHPVPATDDEDEPIVVRPDSFAGRLLPAFLARRARDLDVLDEELARNGFRTIEKVGHNLKGIGRSYGFDGISDIGGALEQAGRHHNADEIRRQTAALAAYLRRVRVAPD
jgi:HPt (histidine-containing phosphotransfer) domain-containing protein